MSNATVLGIVALISLGVFLNGRRFSRMTVNPWSGKSILGQPVEGSDLPIERINLLGKIQMVAAPLFFLAFLAIVLFGGVQFHA